MYDNRSGYKNEPLGDYAWQLLAKIKAENGKIVLTDFLIRELEVNYSMEQINGIFVLFEKHIERIVVTKEQRDEAKKIGEQRKVPPGDVIHALVARDNKLILVTRDNHFNSLKDIALYYKPEELI